jgi:hypothetical protein
VPFKFLSLRSGLLPAAAGGGGALASAAPAVESAGDTAPIQERTITVTFASRRGAGAPTPLYQLHVQVRPRPFVVDQEFRFACGQARPHPTPPHPTPPSPAPVPLCAESDARGAAGAQNDFLKRRVVVDSARAPAAAGWRFDPAALPGLGALGAEPKHPWCSDPSVVVASAPHPADSHLQEVHVKYRCGAAGQSASFFGVLYNDRFRASVYEVWHVTVAAMHRLDVQGLVGQVERVLPPVLSGHVSPFPPY